MELALRWAEIAGLVAFAVSGYLEAERRGMDPIGHFALAFVAAFGGGTLRDLLIDRRPLFWIEHHGWVVGVFVLCLALPWATRLRARPWVERAVQWPDALGMGLFAASGTALSIGAGLPTFVAVLMGVITATFGGAIVDVLCNEVPRIFRRTELHATCAFCGGWAFVGAIGAGAPQPVAIALGAALAFAMRLAAVHRGWRLPSLDTRDAG
ncbi:MAG TPA: trimeric intracellular cation channel family protein [Burkholderiaceae bacterium]|nr:trimeric intracellular cation channel family protein [Burkholderiaceae bacterium]